MMTDGVDEWAELDSAAPGSRSTDGTGSSGPGRRLGPASPDPRRTGRLRRCLPLALQFSRKKDGAREIKAIFTATRT